jgi:5'-AMP-activated protein kinase catalytic alpha subunit
MSKKVGVYEIGKLLGEGSFGSVRMAVNTKNKEIVAMKIIEKEKIKKQELLGNLKKEIEFLMMIEHPNVVKLIEVLASKSKIYLVLEYVSQGELWEKIRKIGRFEEDYARQIFRQIIRALDYCKTKKIAHRDLKPENILLDSSGNVKISDFGLSSLYKDNSNFTNYLHTTCGTVHYLAPEVIQNMGYDGHLADIWSCGVILFFMLAGYQPFDDPNVSKLLEKIVSANYEFPKSFGKSVKDLLTGIFNNNPTKRYDTEKIKSHPWFLEKITPLEVRGFQEDQEKFIQELEKQKSLMDRSPMDRSPMARDNDESRIVEVNSPTMKEKLSGDLFSFAPRRLNAFELATCLCGTLMNRLFDTSVKQIKSAKSSPESSPHSKPVNHLAPNKAAHIEALQQFTSGKKMEEIVETIQTAFAKTECYTHGFDFSQDFKIEAIYHVGKEVVKVACEVFEVGSKIYLVSFTKTEGQLKNFLKIYGHIFQYVKELIYENDPNKDDIGGLIRPFKC